jgi:MFS family permease
MSTHPHPGEDFSLRRIALPAFGPSALASVGAGAITPVIALSARGYGATVGVAALVVAVSSVVELVVALPAGVLVARVGERRALLWAALVDAVASVAAMLAPSLWAFVAALAVFGATSAVFLLARQAYLTDAAPMHLRARAMSTLGGVHRVGLFIGPFVGAPIIAAWGPRSAYAVSAVAGVLTAVLVWATFDVTAQHDRAARADARIGVVEVMRAHRRVLLTVGVGVLVVGIARATRVAVVPLWAESIGLTAAQTSLVFGVAGGVEMLLFYPAGSVMDRFGRVWVAVPTVVVLGLGTLALPLTSTLVGVGVVAVVMGVGNGLGSGLVMTLGADAAPVNGRAQFLGAWRLVSLVGINGGPLLVSLVATVAGLATACVSVGALVVLGGLWLARWVPAYDPRRPSQRDPSTT